MENKIKKIKIAILQIFSESQYETVESEDAYQEAVQQALDSSTFNELDGDELLAFTIPFISGMNRNNSQDLLSFIHLTIGIFDSGNQRISDDSLNPPESFYSANLAGMKIIQESNKINEFSALKVLKDIKNGLLRREDKIFMAGKIKEFNFQFIDWENKEVIKDLLEICLYKALLTAKSLMCEENIKQSAASRQENSSGIEEATPSTRAFTLMPCGHLNPVQNIRKDLLKRRINPNMTMDEYADSVMEEVKERDKIKPQERKKDLEYFRKGDEDKDSRKNFRGNTRNIS